MLNREYWDKLEGNFPDQVRELSVWLGTQYARPEYDRMFTAGITFFDMPHEMQIGILFKFFRECDYGYYLADITSDLEIVQGISDLIGRKFLKELYKSLSLDFNDNE